MTYVQINIQSPKPAGLSWSHSNKGDYIEVQYNLGKIVQAIKLEHGFTDLTDGTCHSPNVANLLKIFERVEINLK